jgi:hypothetical protein
LRRNASIAPPAVHAVDGERHRTRRRFRLSRLQLQNKILRRDFHQSRIRNGHPLAATIIHEHLHLKLWLWWTFEPVAAQAALEVEIDSPVTGRRRQVGMMLQAYLIYAQCIEFYAWAVRDGGFGDIEWPRARLNWLIERAPVLRDALSDVLSGEKAATRMIGAINDGMQPYRMA